MTTRQTTPEAPAAAAGRVWRDDELDGLHERGDKAGKVRDMFAAIARSYDLNNRVHSLWMDQRWRAAAVRAAGVRPGEVVLDCACGTGDLTEAFARRTAAGRVIGTDFTREMLDLAEAKKRFEGAGRVEYRLADAMDLPFDDASVDVVSIAFGIRNVQEPARALAEFARVLRPGGRLVILEFDRPGFPPVRWFNSFYSGWLMPRTATLIAGDRSGAYRYLPKSVASFMPRGEMLGAIERAGLEQARARTLSLGICALYTAAQPATPAAAVPAA